MLAIANVSLNGEVVYRAYRRIPDPPEKRQFSEALLAMDHTHGSRLFVPRAVLRTRSAAAQLLQLLQYAQLLFLLWLAIASKLASVQVVA